MEEIKSLEAVVDDVMANKEASVFHLSKDQLSLLYSSAYHMYENGKYVESKRMFRFLTICEPFERRFWMGLAATSMVLKDYPGALECYSVAALQEPNDPYVHLYAADCFFAQEKNKMGMHALESAMAAAKSSNAKELLLQLLNMHQAWCIKTAKQGENL